MYSDWISLHHFGFCSACLCSHNFPHRSAKMNLHCHMSLLPSVSWGWGERKGKWNLAEQKSVVFQLVLISSYFRLFPLIICFGSKGEQKSDLGSTNGKVLLLIPPYELQWCTPGTRVLWLQSWGSNPRSWELLLIGDCLHPHL